MPIVGEWMTPWIAAAFLVAVLTITYVVGGNLLPVFEQSLLAISICATLTAAALVVVRSSRTRAESLREERARPAAEALDGAGVQLGGTAYVQGMRNWTAAVLELLEHARDQRGGRLRAREGPGGGPGRHARAAAAARGLLR